MREIEPTELTQGESITWQRTYSDYTPDEWTLQYRFRGNGVGFDVSTTADGSAFEATVTAAQTLAAASGRYVWQAWATNIADVTDIRVIGNGNVLIKRGFVSGTTAEIDLRSPAKIMLDTIDAALLAFASSDVTEYEITTPAGSRKVRRSDKTQLSSERKYWAGIVSGESARANARNGKPLLSSVKMRVYDE